MEKLDVTIQLVLIRLEFCCYNWKQLRKKNNHKIKIIDFN